MHESEEKRRLIETEQRAAHWRRWGPYLSERQWATVREDYSPHGDCWNYFPHDQARSRTYRWGEDGLLGFTDRQCRLCINPALWNGRDHILKERLFGLTNPEGNHGEDVKEQYFYLFSTPTHSYVKQLYKYPQSKFPYTDLVHTNRERTTQEREYEILDTGVFDEDRYFDVVAEHAKASPNDILIRFTATNRGPEPAPFDIIAQCWFRNNWTWECTHEGCGTKPRIQLDGKYRLRIDHETLGLFFLEWEASTAFREALFTDNETNDVRILGTKKNRSEHVKDAFHEYVVNGRKEAVNPAQTGTKAGLHHRYLLAPGQSCVLRLRLYHHEHEPKGPSFVNFDELIRQREREGIAFYGSVIPPEANEDERNIITQSYAGLLCSKQFYHYVVEDWLKGDETISTPPAERLTGRNSNWRHLYVRAIISMPDKWEYPWFAAWDVAFHMVPMARIDPDFAKSQLAMFLREWFMHPNGQLPAYEFCFDDVNPPVHAWAARRVYEMEKATGTRDRNFLTSVFQKLLLNFNWWVNRKDAEGHGIFSGGFLGLDNISIFDRSSDVPFGGRLQQADGTGWMGFYCSNMLQIALELARDGERLAVAYEDMASKFFEHFVQIVDAMNTHGGTGLWDEFDGFYYDQVLLDHEVIPIKTRSLVGLLPLTAVCIIDQEKLQTLPGFRQRFEWFLDHRRDLSHYIVPSRVGPRRWLLSAVPLQRLQRMLAHLLDPEEFLAPYGIRSLSKYHAERPFTLHARGEELSIHYNPDESNTLHFGGNSNWRGPVWFPMNHLLIEALHTYHSFYGDFLEVIPTSAATRPVTLEAAARDITQRLANLFRMGKHGRPCHGGDPRFTKDPHWRDLVLFYEYFNADTGRGLGASHQTGWTALAALYLEELAGNPKTVRELAATTA